MTILASFVFRPGELWASYVLSTQIVLSLVLKTIEGEYFSHVIH